MAKCLVLYWQNFRGYLCDNWKPSFWPLLIFNWRTFSRPVAARWWRHWAKNQLLTNQHWRNMVSDCKTNYMFLKHLVVSITNYWLQNLMHTQNNKQNFSLPALKLVHDYLSNRKQRTKVNRTFSSWLEIDFGVLQGSILGPLLFNIFSADLFFVLNDVDIASYADNNTPHVIADGINSVITSLEKASKALFQWFENNLLKSNADKCHLLVSSSDAINLRVSKYYIKNSECEKLLGVTNICRKASRKTYALARIAPYTALSKRLMVRNAFFNSRFNYFPLIWMCHNRTTNRKINKLHERCLRIIYNDKQSPFKMLLEKDSSVSIHYRNIQCLAIEIYTVTNGLSPPVASNIFTQKIVTLPIYDLIVSFPDLLLGLHFTEPKVYPILVHLSGAFFLTVTKTYLILVFLKTRLKNRNSKIVPAGLTLW